MQKIISILLAAVLLTAMSLVTVQLSFAQVGSGALKFCSEFAYSLEEDFVTQGPTPPDGNRIISDGDLLGKNCAVCARNADLLQKYDIAADLGLDAVDVVDVELYLVAFSTELDSPYGQFTAGDLLVTNGAVIPNIALLDKFKTLRADYGLDALQLVGSPDRVISFLKYASTISRQEWLNNPERLAAMLEEFDIDILFSIEGIGPDPAAPAFLDGDLLSARFGIVVEKNSSLLPLSVPAGIPDRGVDFGLDAAALVQAATVSPIYFSTEILFHGKTSFTDGDMLEAGDGVIIPNGDLVICFEPKAGFIGLDALFARVEQETMNALLSQLASAPRAAVAKTSGSEKTAAVTATDAEDIDTVGLQLEACREIAFSTEEDFVTQGPEPPDGNPIISDGDLIGRDCTLCARNQDLLRPFDVKSDLGLDAVDVIESEKELVAFSTELDSPNTGQFTAGDLLATNGAIIPNSALLYLFKIQYDIGLDGLQFVGKTEMIARFLEAARSLGRDFFINNPDELAVMLRKYELDIWFSTEGTGPMPISPVFLDGDLLSAATGVIVEANSTLLPADVPAGIPDRGVDFGLDAVTGRRDGARELLNFSTEILFEETPAFTDGDILKRGNGVVSTNRELISCFEPEADFVGLDALSSSCWPELEWTWNSTTVEPEYDQVMMAPVAADVNSDRVPDIIFSTFSKALGWQGGGILRAISGAGGSEIFSVTSPNYRVNAGAEPAVADIDKDGKPEIVVSKDSGHIICFENDGSFKWISSTVIGRVAVAVADLDEDGTPEIIAGRTVFNNDGTVRWTGVAGSSYASVVADLDLNGHPEVITGGTAYRFDGAIYWNTSPAGNPAIGNFDDDPYPEIVIVGSDMVTMKEHDGTVKWGPVSMPPGGGNGPPVVADIDGDGQLEIGVGGYDYYVAFETNGTVKWMTEIRDHSSRAASSTAFDFNQDGRFEIVYSDEEKLRIFKGDNGAVLFEAPGPSGTLMEQPIILDVDNDRHAEIVVAVNNYAFPGNTGIEVYGNDSCWPDARKIWNQHTYHITNINPNASVPQFEPDNWKLYNNYRTQALSEPCECDLNIDGSCNMADWLLFGQDWGRTDCLDPGVVCECDLNTDGSCNMADWLLFGQDWGRMDCPVP
ncbi:MAG: VCBS repeat-containing protein [Proteobacteria bacterium]|nr:VCBS repeat-containing protein [Pseudomonadota bacterium]MBU4296970.1 VCBS repeat-containing protein [Pseudomonadota bacterium]MCG2748568.1 FG-GAP-like repeat-containing protein [Desulfobulbaceae bacterium]